MSCVVPAISLSWENEFDLRSPGGQALVAEKTQLLEDLVARKKEKGLQRERRKRERGHEGQEQKQEQVGNVASNGGIDFDFVEPLRAVMRSAEVGDTSSSNTDSHFYRTDASTQKR